MATQLLLQLSQTRKQACLRQLLEWSRSGAMVPSSRCYASSAGVLAGARGHVGSISSASAFSAASAAAPAAAAAGPVGSSPFWNKFHVLRRAFSAGPDAGPQGMSRDMLDKISASKDTEETTDDDDAEGEGEVDDGPLPPYVLDEFSTKLTQEDVNSYYNILKLPEGWTKGLEAEFKVSNTNFVMYRQCMHDLFERIEGSFNVLRSAELEAEATSSSGSASDRQAHFLLQGPRGSGKSVVLGAAVEFSRLCGAVVVYIPSCENLIDGGMYHKNEEAGGWDTPDHARWLINSLLGAHGHRLESAPAPSGNGSLREVAEAGLTRDGNVMDAVLELLEGLRTTTAFPVVFAMDDYNALYSHTGYYEAVSFKKRRMIKPEELRLANALRMLEYEPVVNGICIASPTYGNAISPKLRIPYQKGALYDVPALDEAELERMSEFYADYDAISSRPDASLLLRMSAMTSGNGEEFRKYITLT